MRKLCYTIITILSLQFSFGQQQKSVATYLSAEFNSTVHERVVSANPWGAGIGLQSFFNATNKFQPTVELTGDVYLLDDKVYRTNPDGTEIKRVGSMVNLFGGAAFFPYKTIYFSLLAGPSMVNDQLLFGLKPTIGLVFSANKKWTAKVSFIDVFKRDKTTGDDFTSLSVAIGVKIF